MNKGNEVASYLLHKLENSDDFKIPAGEAEVMAESKAWLRKVAAFTPLSAKPDEDT